MNWNFSEISKSFLKDDKGKLLVEGNFGMEKESQRVTSSGDLALTFHPAVFGDKIKNPRITTDFSESQIEMITPTFKSIEEVYAELDTINIEVENGIGDELLWPLSMPPRLPDEDNIPIARFPDSEDGKYMETYRNGLALRYGKKMQMISGIHYNFSFSEGMVDYLYKRFGNGNDKRSFIDEMHFALARNFLRYRWMLIYLFGASPYSHHTYYSVINNEIEIIQKCCQCCVDVIENFNKYATSLRVSRFGYSNALKNKHSIYFNSLEEYSEELRKLMATKNTEYSKLGVYKNGSQIQLNGNILQKENEFYSSIRLKQNTNEGETQLDALEKRGVKYIEVRILDLNPFEKVGLSIDEMNFLQVFMLFCLFEQSDIITEDEHARINLNHHLVALYGRKENLMLQKYNKGTIGLKSWGKEIFERLKNVAELMDKGTGDDKYCKIVEEEYKKLFDISLLPSERIHREMEENNENFLEFGTRYAINNSQKNIIRKT
ncbi:glutamate--cysteine ligase [Methanobacterium paludis]|uniref:glutamate--cysteine ligase n=1 Tax=Methanobacterium paludis (strain DSM 25820 / JCM 18151 / SWAN1) TaxID=868131 RepID=F6D4S1_METPW|nr:glutamate--cysteine ligase [Methanobacterium paludis]AEG18130.1 Glutamate--cysteine ligase [Methanobacterium paludis]